jgi:N6-adenosine-specific RNA methylase IME4
MRLSAANFETLKVRFKSLMVTVCFAFVVVNNRAAVQCIPYRTVETIQLLAFGIDPMNTQHAHLHNMVKAQLDTSKSV